MIFVPILLGISLLLFLITVVKLDTFIAFTLVCLFVGIASGLSINDTVATIQLGIGNTLGDFVVILGFGAMLGKLVAESGAADNITQRLVDLFGKKNIQLSLMVTGFIVGIPMFYTVGFVILVPFAIALAVKTKLPLLYIGLPMLASLSVTHGFLPPHPAPTAIAAMYGADLGKTMIYGMIAGIPAIMSAKWLLSGVMKKVVAVPLKDYVIISADPAYKIPSLGISLLVALLPVVLIAGTSIIKTFLPGNEIVQAIGNPAISLLVAVMVAIYFLGIRTGRSMTNVMKIVSEAVSGIAMILLIIAGAGAFKEIMLATHINDEIALVLGKLGMSPILLAWLIAAIIRLIVGSATVAGLTAAGIMLPMIAGSGTAPELMVLATGAGSIFFSHINDGGFWLFKEYFNLSIKDTLRSWTLMETIVSLVGLLMVLLLNIII